MELFVGTFNVPYLYTLYFDQHLQQLNVTHISNAAGPHSWLSLSPNQKTLYATSWTEPSPGVAAYRNGGSDSALELLNSMSVRELPGYVTCSSSHLYSVGGKTGEVFRIGDDGALGALVQEVDFRAGHGNDTNSPGGLRHGSHGCDLSPDGKTLYVADIGVNGVWTFSVDDSQPRVLSRQKKHDAPRQNDGPRHTWPHPNGQILYVIDEHSSMVDVFKIDKRCGGIDTSLKHIQSASALPKGKNMSENTGDEVRFSTGPDKTKPQYLFASTRGIPKKTRGFISVFELDTDGKLKSTDALHIWETPTSGGLANAVEPAPWTTNNASPNNTSLHYLALTDAESGKVHVLSFNGEQIQDVAAVTLRVPASGGSTSADPVQPATAVWMRPAA
ncbi:hypothetical protein QQS21_004769 [Conoideocrella luteorostrata]|uniref:Muconate cycloisomerase 1 n=1 Tax=Conoideocrella luteorostrata TaxID=1105319 RepID=A0AAJ0FV63_9HYPO|nr:hypothetical protein QQS21_004769 [Conoideocrella luteorostrata]